MKAVAPRLQHSTGRYYNGSPEDGEKLQCAEGPHFFDLPRKFSEEKEYVMNRVDAKIFEGFKVLNLDDEALPLAKDKVKSEDDKFFLTSQIMESKKGIQVVIYAGEKGSSKKTQLFIDPAAKRLSFDHTNLHPSEVFLKIEATFIDGSKSSIVK
ncbi:MAG: hypothetical protein WD887_02870 [Candidatus Saccharimonadales bacterium]